MKSNLEVEKNSKFNKVGFARLYSKYGMFFLLIIMIIISALMDSVFLTPDNISNVFRNMAIVSLVAFGMTYLLVLGMIDLSAGSVMALSGCLACMVVIETNSMILAIVAAVSVAVLAALINGLIITKFKIPAFIMTLAMQLSARGAVLMVTKGRPISGMPDKFKLIGQGTILKTVPVPVIVMIVAFAVAWILLNRTKFGRHVLAVGGNMKSAEASGVNVNATIIKSYLLHGLLVGFAGVMFMSRLNSGQPAGAVNAELDAITSSVVGGTSMAGGIGTIQGTFVGGLIISILNNMMNLRGLNANWQLIVKGVIIAASVIIDYRTKEILKERSVS